MNDSGVPNTPQIPPLAPLTPVEERTWAMLAHLSIVVNLFTGFLGTVLALIIYLVYRDRSKFVAYQAMQALLFQLITWVGAGIIAIILWIVGGVLAIILIGLLIFPLALLFSLIPLAAVIYGIVAGIRVYQGVDFQYWLVGDWTRRMLSS
jgi:uncharacterized Tic20 family protein